MSRAIRSRPGPPDDAAPRAAAAIRERTEVVPQVGVILGSGLGDAVGQDVRTQEEVTFGELPGFPAAAVPGHEGRIELGELYGVPAAVLFGRVHWYEGHGMETVTLPVRLLAELGVRTLVLTNAAGGLNPDLPLGALMLIRDHINFMGVNPLLGWRYAGGEPAFVDVSTVWDTGAGDVARMAAGDASVPLPEGVYAAVSGPSYETPAECEMLLRMGADAVGMSTVPEAVAAAAVGIRCLGFSCITDVAGTELTHEEVLAVATKAAPDLRAILQGTIPQLGEGS